MCIESNGCKMISNKDTIKTIPMEEIKYKEGKNHAIKIPSSLGLFIVESSCFFVSGPKVQKKGKGRHKGHKFKKIVFAEKQKAQQERLKREKLQDLMLSYCLRAIQLKTKCLQRLHAGS